VISSAIPTLTAITGAAHGRLPARTVGAELDAERLIALCADCDHPPLVNAASAATKNFTNLRPTLWYCPDTGVEQVFAESALPDHAGGAEEQDSHT
jgi:hypothetical protein